MKKIVTVIGARPQFIKAAALSEIMRVSGVQEIIVHTGQHYDKSMSDVFFSELDIPKPNYNCNIGSANHGEQTGKMLTAIEKILLSEKPDFVLVYGDTNSTLAGALAAIKLHIPLAHVEAGLRSYNNRMPEEINRVLTDRISSLLFCPSQNAADNLIAEGITSGVYVVGDVMLDALQRAVLRAKKRSNILSRLNLSPGRFILMTIHRAENTDNDNRFRGILKGLAGIDQKLVFPVHPRTKKNLGRFSKEISKIKYLQLIEPVGYLDMVSLEQSAKMILTDSGGIQKEAYWLKVPCITLRTETEWVETVNTGWNKIAGTDYSDILKIIADFRKPEKHPSIYGKTGACKLIRNIIQKNV